jgi:hypothetical protein
LRPGGANPAIELQLLYVPVTVVVANSPSTVRYAGKVTTEVDVVRKLHVHGISRVLSMPPHANELQQKRKHISIRMIIKYLEQEIMTVSVTVWALDGTVLNEEHADLASSRH